MRGIPAISTELFAILKSVSTLLYLVVIRVSKDSQSVMTVPSNCALRAERQER